MFTKITILGDGAMGCVCGSLLCEKGLNVTLWGHDAAQLAQIAETHENKLFLPGYSLPDAMHYEASDGEAMVDADLIVSAVPCQYVRGVFKRLRPHLPGGVPIVSVTKGIEHETLLRSTQILEQVLGADRPYAVLSGPTIADEIARKLPATATAACSDEALARQIAETFTTDYFRVYWNADSVGVELSGALKNVIAIAAGIIDGIGAGDNAKAALITRGLAEIQRLGLAMGAAESTFAGLSGLGDLVTTCISPHGRNRSFGERIGKGMSAKDALAATHSVIEGVHSCAGVLALAERYDIEMPITQAIYDLIHKGKSVKEALHDLMSRELKAE